jgi:hypothetical protein
MASITDYLVDIVKNSWTVVATADAALATATKAAEGVANASPVGAGQRHHVVTKVDASYESSTQSGLLQVKFGTTVVGSKWIHGAGALDFGVLGFQNPDSNEAVSAELAAGGAGIEGHITLSGYTTGPNL